MFDLVPIEYEELVNLKEAFELEMFINIYKDVEEISKVLSNGEVIGVMVAREEFDGVLIDYFEIFLNKRNEQLGSKFISFIKGISKNNLYVTPLPESLNFWTKCGFMPVKNMHPILKCKCN